MRTALSMTEFPCTGAVNMTWPSFSCTVYITGSNSTNTSEKRPQNLTTETESNESFTKTAKIQMCTCMQALCMCVMYKVVQGMYDEFTVILKYSDDGSI